MADTLDRTIADRVRARIVEVLGNQGKSLTGDESLIDDLKADSLDVVELVITLENEFDRKFDEEQFAQLLTVNDVVRFVEGQING